MLQQTQVERVIPHFERFVEAFPNVEALASSPIERVLAAWSGLGYYRRARYLHAAARQIVVAGRFPREIGQLLDLPGIGPYTAAAIASIAFGAKVPVLDGNVERVLARFKGLNTDPKRAPGRRRLLETAAFLLDDLRAGDSNQALMELGATVCRPRRPRCGSCPLASGCVAFEKGDQERYPVRSRREKRIVEHRMAVVVGGSGKVLLVRRPEESEILAGFWEVPWIPRCERNEAEKDLSSRYGGRWRLHHARGQVRHGITFRDIRVDVWEGQLALDGGVAEACEAGWFSAAKLDRVPLSTLVRKILAKASWSGSASKSAGA